MLNNKFFWGLAVLALVAALLYNRSKFSNSEPQMTPRIAFIVGSPDPFWQQVIVGAQKAAEVYPAKLSIIVPKEGGEDQTAKLLTLPAEQYEGLAISPLEPDKQERKLSILASDMKVVTYDNDAPNSLRHSHVGTNNYVAGRLCGELIKQAIPDGGKIALFVGDHTRMNAQLRRQGLVDVLNGEERTPGSDLDPIDQVIEAGNYTIVKTYLDGSVPAKAKENAVQALQDYPDLDCMVALYGYNCPMCLEALEEAEKLGEIQVVAFDQAKETLDGIENGYVYASVAQNPYQYGYEAVRVLVSLVNKTPHMSPFPGMGDNYLSCKSVSKDNLGEFRKKLESPAPESKSK